MAGLDPRLSGSCRAPVQLQLASVSWLGGIVVAQARDVSSVHQIGAHESSEFEEAVLCFGNVLQLAEQQECDERDGDLNAHGVFGASEEFGDFQGLLHHAEEELDLPAALVEVGNLLSGGVEVVAENA